MHSNKSQTSLRADSIWPTSEGGSVRVFERSNKVLADYLPKKMAEGIADCMPLALRSVGDAIRHDSENRTKV